MMRHRTSYLIGIHTLEQADDPDRPLHLPDPERP
ncbi:hypothetical protein BOS5A_110683 [Bosea sp. EC-HK365B]|nr:hypothetical protein BOSE7B_110110 [Bosea sp. 7B]CAD5281289.1 hypothetical protein BOSE21B_30926 [Bosea sp. 21B]VVT52357.1 hypothetical protein BOS5A_110683 [Bosea sp. EC-HK365B]VXB86154.1 hypothetical protein BOSE127_150172 [Bosea sp. 127]